MKRALIVWPIGTAVCAVVLSALGLAMRSSRFKKLDEHTPPITSKRSGWLSFWIGSALH